MENLYLGTQGWSYSSWVGNFYPAGTPAARYLDIYAHQFDTVELDTTFYAIPRLSTVDGWRERTPDGFRFAAKFPQVISHEKGLVDCGQETMAFLETMTHLDQKLGPLLLQMPPSFTIDGMPALTEYVAGLPTGFRYALEVRHSSWTKGAAHTALLDLLTKYGIALCLVQHAWMPRLDEVTAPFVYIRWMGRREDVPDDDFSRVRVEREAQLDTWATQIKGYLGRGLPVYGYFNNHYQGHSPASVRSIQERLLSVN
jgi:uncharacterized protein YecE (DUF72 family)